MPRPLKNSLKPLDLGSEPVSARLKNFRRKRGFTQAEVAKMVGITRESIAAYEAGRVRISDDILVRFALSLGVSADKLLGISGQSLESPSSLRIMRRMKKIEKLPPSKQKAILQTLDMALQSVESSDTK